MGRIPFKIVAIEIILVCSLGFPGNYSLLFGDWFSYLVEYGCFALEFYFVFIEGRNNYFRLKKSRVPLILFPILIFVMSILVTNYIDLQLISCLRFMLTIYFALWIADKYDIEQALEIFCRAQAIFVVLTLAFCVLSPQNSFESTIMAHNAMTGLYPTKNMCGFQLSFGIILYVIKIKGNFDSGEKNSMGIYIMTVIQCVMLVAAQTVGGLLITVFMVIYIFFLSGKRINMAWGYVLVNLAFFVLCLTLLPALNTLLSFLGKDITISGRTTLWSTIIEFMTVDRDIHFWTGYGFCMFWRDPSAYRSLQSLVANQYSFWATNVAGAHNCVMELWLNIGTFGLLAFIYMFFHSLKNYKSMYKLQYLFVSAQILYFTVHGLTERTIDTYSYSILFLFIAFAYALKKKRASEKGVQT